MRQWMSFVVESMEAKSKLESSLQQARVRELRGSWVFRSRVGIMRRSSTGPRSYRMTHGPSQGMRQWMSLVVECSDKNSRVLRG
mgnify:CR=1 FL=1